MMMSSSSSSSSFLLLLLLLLFTVVIENSIVVVANDFEPYDLNGGLVCAVAGTNFCIISTDTRMFGGGGYLLQSRNHLSSRLWVVNNNLDDDPSSILNLDRIEQSLIHGSGCDIGVDSSSLTTTESSTKTKVVTTSKIQSPPVLIGSSGCIADCSTLKRVVRSEMRAANYFFDSQISSTPTKVANLLSQILYLKRSFPYYSFCVLGGINPTTNHGEVFVYDAIGSYEQVAVAAAGTGREALQPILDRLFTEKEKEIDEESSSLVVVSTPPPPPVKRRRPRRRQLFVKGTANEAIEKLYNAYRSVSEREIGVGDKLVFHVSECDPITGDYNCRVIVRPLKEH